MITRKERERYRALGWSEFVALCDALDAADALRTGPWFTHIPTCAVNGDYRHSSSAWLVVKNPQPCDCGLDAALAAYDALVERT